MDVQTTEQRQGKELVGQDGAKRHHADGVRTRDANGLKNVTRYARGLDDGDTKTARLSLDRRRLKPPASAAYRIRPREDKGDLMGASKLLKRGDGEVGRAHEHDAHSSSIPPS